MLSEKQNKLSHRSAIVTSNSINKQTNVLIFKKEHLDMPPYNPLGGLDVPDSKMNVDIKCENAEGSLLNKVKKEVNVKVVTPELNGVEIFLLNAEGNHPKVSTDDPLQSSDDEEMSDAADDIEEHMNTNYEAQYQHTVLFCKLCDYEAEDFQALEVHIKSRHEERKYSCTVCDYKHTVLNRVTFHIAEKHGEKNIQCTLCEYVCATQRGLNRHNHRKHRERKIISCDQCDYKSDSSNVKRHRDARHNGGQYFMCDQCSYLGKNLRSLKRHKEKHKGILFECEDCEYKTSTRQLLASHVKGNHVDLHLKCTDCDYECPTYSRMKRHTEERHSDNSFQCNDCDYKGRTKDNLYYHKVKEHTAYVCTICQKEESSRYMLNKHIATHAERGYIEEENSACNLCDFVGLNKRSLQYHQKKHKGEIFSCDKCEYSSPTLTQLRSHCNSKHGERKFKCEFCDMKFKANWILKQHMDRKHSITEAKKPKLKIKENSEKEDLFMQVKIDPDIDNIEEVQVEPDFDNIVKQEPDLDDILDVKEEPDFNNTEGEQMYPELF